MVQLGNRVFVRFINKLAFAALTCIFALGGAVVGIIPGALKGQTTETGFARGAFIGIVAGAITGVQLLESIAIGETLSKAALFGSVMNGKVFREWVSPAVLKAYQWQISTVVDTTYSETYSEISNVFDAYMESSDIYDISGVQGLSFKTIQNLPRHKFCSSESDHQSCCTICLMDIRDGEFARKLASCRHLFHMDCIDMWLARHGTCPICRDSL